MTDHGGSRLSKRRRERESSSRCTYTYCHYRHSVPRQVRSRVKARLGVDPYEAAKEDRRERYILSVNLSVSLSLCLSVCLSVSCDR